ncbi:Molybdenum ABC transporter, periplasmic binding protein [Nitrospina gracilis 3/211]|uniref:Molybdenum ABC transporter, periplasmic binding protein n=1 Tax=Nitrospina gracilis (strain 3/211) TaxID=1266370 RepID=M1YUF6_NITG3|nr:MULTISPECIES: molybdate ABC transporter substrate-binding protein [Nitrospina]MCF8722531.1 molybdate transport system substrate-binding protein [Nitrospina sp. Nb-3]CCQ89207.1 Molybdenum ABC transporter, periplasmic binding protein [Nitrospina gracilis 3/211]
MSKWTTVLGVMAVFGFPALSCAETVTVAVASNFLGPLKQIARQFEAETGHAARIVSGSTGKLYAQIKNGAPFHVFLAADSKRPRLLEEEQLASPGWRFTYARGKLVLWSADPESINEDGAGVLKTGKFRHLAVANPKTAPYGRATQSTLQKLGLWEALQQRIVRGENVVQTFQFAASGNAEFGFVALSQVLALPPGKQGSRWDVPQSFHPPIDQDAVLLAKGIHNAAAKALLEFLKSPATKRQIGAFGYDTD